MEHPRAQHRPAETGRSDRSAMASSRLFCHDGGSGMCGTASSPSFRCDRRWPASAVADWLDAHQRDVGAHDGYRLGSRGKHAAARSPITFCEIVSRTDGSAAEPGLGSAPAATRPQPFDPSIGSGIAVAMVGRPDQRTGGGVGPCANGVKCGAPASRLAHRHPVGLRTVGASDHCPRSRSGPRGSVVQR